MPYELIRADEGQKLLRSQIADDMRELIKSAEAIADIVESDPCISEHDAIRTRYSLIEHHLEEAKGKMDAAFTIGKIEAENV